MLITQQFVFVHLPKTGGTFVSKVLQRIHEARGEPMITRRADDPAMAFERIRALLPQRNLLFVRHWNGSEYNQHGHARNIPAPHRKKPIMAVIRNPYDRYVSEYEFRWWANFPKKMSARHIEIAEAFPNFPDLSFAEFVQMADRFYTRGGNPHYTGEDKLGWHTEQFFIYFGHEAHNYRQITLEMVAANDYSALLLPNLNFIFQDNLNAELYDFLLKHGYSAEELAFVPTAGKINPHEGGRRDEQHWTTYYTPELKALIRQRERLLFAMFPQFDV